MAWDYYGQVVGTESRTMRLGFEEGLTLDSLRAFVSVCEQMPGAADIRVECTDSQLRLIAEVRTSQSVAVDGPRLCSECDGAGIDRHADDPCRACAGTGHPLPVDPDPTMPMPIVTAVNGGDRA